MSGFDRYDNTVTYATPAFAGFKVYAQYSFDTDTKDDYDGAGLHGPGVPSARTKSEADQRRPLISMPASSAFMKSSSNTD